MFRFTINEIRDLIISFIVIALGFTILYSNGDYSHISIIFPVVLIGVGLGFVFHELGHKFLAMHYGYYAEYQLWPTGLLIALVSSFFGFIFAAPGAVVIYSQGMEKKTNGIISIAGPVVNIILGLIFFLILGSLGDFIYTDMGAIVYLICVLGTRINFFLAAFNLLPIPPLDGSKVLSWSVPIWLITFAIAALLVLFFGGIL
ncbi:site-2 protease family protein [Methanobrevibacter olleyae]|uniref:Peptidase M50 family n=1 Tax=Methanobrevibacter olleyae TaxID=294671 RepID=A0A126QXJ8_METOL|nr:site-2 protease family protein [Methanobrevibacter olleyae]AMK14568.1 peptidase M50 family [Methanobrevibacter olleyae]SFL27960.1 Zn-dependent protease (includes SpoIVFB) [Methanobrevibacter olleyae]